MNKVRTISRIQCENLKFIGIFLSLTCSSSILLMPSPTLYVPNGVLIRGEVSENTRMLSIKVRKS